MRSSGIFILWLDNNPENYNAIAGKFIELKEPKSKGDKIELKWKLDKDKIIHISMLNEEFGIKSSNDYTDEIIKNNHIQNLTINRGGI